MMHRFLTTSTPTNQPSTMRAGKRGGHWSDNDQTSNWRIMGGPRKKGSHLIVKKLWTMVLRVTATNSITSDVRGTHRSTTDVDPRCGLLRRREGWHGHGGLVQCLELANCTTGRRRAPSAARHDRW